VDGETGYRNYTNDQLARLHRILALKQLGLTLETIARVIEEPASIEACLQMKARELEETVQTESRRLREVNNLLK
jgi:DNA-binding transcriptional MerR regulator